MRQRWEHELPIAMRRRRSAMVRACLPTVDAERSWLALGRCSARKCAGKAPAARRRGVAFRNEGALGVAEVRCGQLLELQAVRILLEDWCAEWSVPSWPLVPLVSEFTGGDAFTHPACAGR